MNQTPLTPHRPARFKAPLALVAGVLLVHLMLLAGDLLPWGGHASTGEKPSTVHAAGDANAPLATAEAARDPQLVPAGASFISQVRWIEAPAALPVPLGIAPLPTKSTRSSTSPKALADAAIPAPLHAKAPAANLVEPAGPDQITDDSDPPAEEATLTPAPATPEAAAPAPEQELAQAYTRPEPTPAAPDEELLARATPAAGDKNTRVVKPAKNPVVAPLPPAQPPAATRLQYDIEGQVKGFNYSATAVLDWAPDGAGYQLRTEVRVPLLGKRVQTSAGLIDASGLHPERFADRARSEKAAHFDHALQRIRFSNNAPETALLPGAQDRLSVFLQLGALFNARPDAYAAGKTIALQVAGTSDAEIWRFDVGAQETLALPAGSVLAWRLSRVPRKPYDSAVEIWLAPALQHLPVRIRIQQDNGDVVDQRLSQKP